MYSNMKYYENICNCLRVIQQNINRKLKSANCWQQTSLNYISLCLICEEAPPRTELGEIKDSRENVLRFYFSIVPAVPVKFQGLVLHKQNDSAL